MSVSNVWITFAASGMLLATSSLARAQECIGAPAREVLACADSPRVAHGDTMTSHVAPPRVTAEAAETPTRPGLDLDPHDELAQPGAQTRTVDLMEHEIATLERILSRGDAHTPHQAEYLQRLADTYFELETFERRLARSLDARVYDDDTEATTQQTAAETQAADARDHAITTYARLVREHPELPNLDQVLFSLAFGLGESQQFEQARQVYLRIVRDFPNSRFVPHAWLSFAEHYFEEGDMSAADALYAHVLETPPEAPNPVYGYALYKRAWVRFNLEDFAGALTQFARVLEFAEQHPDARDVGSLARQARRELVLPYARVGRPSQALAFFRRYADDADQAIEMLESLGQAYEDAGQWPEAIQVYHQLMSERPRSDALCRWQSRVTSAVISSRPKPEQRTEAQRLVDVMNAFARASHPDDAVRACRQTTATILVELATAWHREAIGDGTQPGTLDRTTMRLAGELYRLVVAELPDMEQLDYPEIDRRDWPTLYRVSYFYAELLWRMDDFRACGPAFDRVVTLDPNGEYTTDAAYAEVLCWDRVYQADYQPRERERTHEGTAPRDLSDDERAMAHAFQRYLCTAPDGEDRATVQYRLARIYYEARHFEEASVAFRAVAMEHADDPLGEIAANLHLDALNAIFRRDGRASCVTDLRSDLAPIAGLYCATPTAATEHPDLCPTIDQLQCDVLRLEAESIAHAGDHAVSARRYVAIARDHATCGRRDEMLWNAAIEYEAARLLGRAIQVRQALVDGFPNSDLAHRAAYLLGASYHALAIYSSAADWYERFARESPDAETCTDAERAAGTCAIAHVALENAVFFRLGLGETDRAIADAGLYERSYRRARPRETSAVVFSLGAIYESQGDWAHVLSHYRAFLRDYGRSARPDEVVRANVQIGRAQQELDHGDQAGAAFRAALGVWERGASEAIAELDATPEERALWEARARDGASEAEFYLAEERFAAFEAIRFPRFSGQRTVAAVMRWSTTELGPWLTRRFEALRAAEQAYDRIASLAVPEWQIAAASRVGEMYRSIVDDVRSAPVPAEIEDDDELYGIYSGTLEAVLNGSSAGPDGQWETADDLMCTRSSTEPSCVRAPLRQAAERFSYCLTLATRVRWFDERSAACERELHAMDAAAYPLAAELRGTPAFDADRLAPPSAVELDRDDDLSESASSS